MNNMRDIDKKMKGLGIGGGKNNKREEMAKMFPLALEA